MPTPASTVGRRAFVSFVPELHTFAAPSRDQGLLRSLMRPSLSTEHWQFRDQGEPRSARVPSKLVRWAFIRTPQCFGQSSAEPLRRSLPSSTCEHTELGFIFPGSPGTSVFLFCGHKDGKGLCPGDRPRPCLPALSPSTLGQLLGDVP